jgi:hypothetical protein
MPGEANARWEKSVPKCLVGNNRAQENFVRPGRSAVARERKCPSQKSPVECFCDCVPCNAISLCTIAIPESESIFELIYFRLSERLPDRKVAALPSAPRTRRAASIGFGAAIIKVEQVKVKKGTRQAMRGSALRAPGNAVSPCAPRGLAGAIQPRAPRPRGALPLVGSRASERFASDTSDRIVRPFGICAQGALLPETPASKECTAPFRPYPHLRRRVVL